MRDGTKALKILRNKILRLELRPGAVIDENALATALSMSRTPIREAIIQLISEGLAFRDGRVARVATLNFDEVPPLYDALLVASRMINRLAAEHRTHGDMEAIKAAHELFDEKMYGGDDIERQEANVHFHLAIARAAHNAYFYDFYQKVLSASSRLSRACFARADEQVNNYSPITESDDPELHGHVTETSRQHALMVKAIGEQNVAAADELAVMHQELALGRIKRLLFSRSNAVGGIMLEETAA